MAIIPINEYQETVIKTVMSFSVECRSLQLFNSATFIVNLFDKSGSLIDKKIVTINQQQYSQWNADDTYIINLIAQILGFTFPETAHQIESGP